MVQDFDIVVRGGKVLDGTGADSFSADIGISGNEITAMGDLTNYNAGRTIDASGRYVSPGFIDMHTHAERGLPHPELAPSDHYLLQGVTSVVGGADGYGGWPIHSSMNELVEKLNSQGIGTNAGFMVGLGQVRRQVTGPYENKPTFSDRQEMMSRIRHAMGSGAIGISSGLIFAPDRYFDTDGIVEMVKEVVPFGGIYHTHVRDESDRLIESVKEAIEISDRSGATTVITHFKSVYKRNWGKLRQATDLIESARGRGLNIYADQFPFIEGGPVSLVPATIGLAGSDEIDEKAKRIDSILKRLNNHELLLLRTELVGIPPEKNEIEFWKKRPEILRQTVTESLSHAMPSKGAGLFAIACWYGMHQGPDNPGTRADFFARLTDPNEASEIISKVAAYIDDLGGPDNIIVFGTSRTQLEFSTLADAAVKLGETEVGAAIKLTLEGVRGIVTLHSEDDVEYAMRKNFVATGSDGDYPYFGTTTGNLGAPQSIRAYSTFATKLGKYVLERGTITLPHAVRAATSLPAKILGWSNRGILQEGYRADIVVFDPSAVKARSDLSYPHQYSKGFEHVLVNGQVAVEGGVRTKVLAGEVIGIG